MYGHASDPDCFRRGHDIVMPAPLKRSFIEEAIPVLENRRPRENIYFRGSITRDNTHGDLYSKGVRQRLYELYHRDPEFFFGDVAAYDYGHEMAEAKFCLCLPGFAPWSPRLIESVLAGCIPVIISDDIVLPFEDIVDWTKFSIRVSESDLEHLPDLLFALTPAQVRQLLDNVERARTYFTWSELPVQGMTDGADGVVASIIFSLAKRRAEAEAGG